MFKPTTDETRRLHLYFAQNSRLLFSPKEKQLALIKGWIINYCILEMEADNEPVISLPVYFKNENMFYEKTTKKKQRRPRPRLKKKKFRESNSGPPTWKVNALFIAPQHNTVALEIRPHDAVWSRQSLIYEELKDIFEENEHGFDS